MTLEKAKERKRILQYEKKQVEESKCLSAELKEEVLQYYKVELKSINNEIAYLQMIGECKCIYYEKDEGWCKNQELDMYMDYPSSHYCRGCSHYREE